MADADKVYVKAKALLDAGDDAGAEREADRYLLLVQALDSEADRWGTGIPGQRILAEVYVRQGRYAAALEMSQDESKWGTADLNARESAVKAVALAGLNHLDEARETLARALKMDNVPVFLRGDLTDLISAHRPSAAALAATAWLIHAVETTDGSKNLARPLKDYEAALRLAPKNPVVALNAARFYRKTAKRPDLARKALAQAVGGSEATRALLRRESDLLSAETPNGG